MSVACGAVCLDCLDESPSVGDGGYVGSPSLRPGDEDVRGWGRMPTFWTLYEPLVGLGLRPYELETFWAWLKVHADHRLYLCSTGDDDEPPELDQMWSAPDAKRKAVALGKQRDADKAAAIVQGIFRVGRYEVGCPRCAASLTTPEAEPLKALGATTVSADAVQQFLERWVPVLKGSGCGLWRMMSPTLDPTGEFPLQFAAFLKTHVEHDMRAQLVE